MHRVYLQPGAKNGLPAAYEYATSWDYHAMLPQLTRAQLWRSGASAELAVGWGV